MTADVRTFKAATMQQALDLVRQELGSDAVILHTRQLSKRRLLPWQRPLEEVEITAGIGMNVGGRPEAASGGSTHGGSTHGASAYGGSAYSQLESSPAAPRTARAVASPRTSEPSRIGSQLPTGEQQAAAAGSRPTIAQQALAAAQQAEGSAVRSGSRQVGTPRTVSQRHQEQLSPPPDLLGLQSPTAANSPVRTSPVAPRVARPELPTTIPMRSSSPATEANRSAAPATADLSDKAKMGGAGVRPLAIAPGTDATAAVYARLDKLQQMIADLSQQHAKRSLDQIPAELFPLYTRLVEQEVDSELARDLVFRLKQSALPIQLAQPHTAEALLTGLVEHELNVGAPIQLARGRRKVVMLVGPTGVGKTTTIAKLAAHFRLQEHARVGLVTVDTYRVAAVEQLRTYAEIIDLPMKVVATPVELRHALDELASLDLVLIDTAGRSPRDELQIRELQAIVAEAHADDVCLVLSTASGSRTLEHIARQFAPVGITSLILTKLDEATSPGVVLSVARQIPYPVTYLTMGQDVPEDLEPAQSARLARWIMGEAELHTLARAA